MRLFHTTQSPERILADGFRDVLGPFQFVHRTHYGVFVAASPAPRPGAGANEVVLTRRIALTPAR